MPTPAEIRAQVDPRYSEDQWKYWLEEAESGAAPGSYDDSCPPSDPFRNKATGECLGKPWDCPTGTTQHGDKCVPIEQLPDWAKGGAKPAAAAPAEPAVPLTPAQQMQNALMGMFSGQQGVFGYSAGRTPLGQQLQGQFGVGPDGKPLPQAAGIKGKGLAGGGIVWGPSGGYTDLSGFGGPDPMVLAGSKDVYDTGTPGYKPWEKPTGAEEPGTPIPPQPGVPRLPGGPASFPGGAPRLPGGGAPPPFALNSGLSAALGEQFGGGVARPGAAPPFAAGVPALAGVLAQQQYGVPGPGGVDQPGGAPPFVPPGQRRQRGRINPFGARSPFGGGGWANRSF